MNNLISKLFEIQSHLKGQRLKIWEGGEISRTTNNLDELIDLLYAYSDFADWDKKERQEYLDEGFKNRNYYIDANITVTF